MKILIMVSCSDYKERYYDGFSAAIEYINTKFKNTSNIIHTINTFYKSLPDQINTHGPYDIGIIKSHFNSCNKELSILKAKKILTGLFISSVCVAKDNHLKLYDVLFYETEWYRKHSRLDRHNNIFHALGVDTNIMKKRNLTKEYDVLSVGHFAAYKRYNKLEQMPGKRLAIGQINGKHKRGEKINPIIVSLQKNNVEVKDYMDYEKLSEHYNKSKLCYVPCTTVGGGERAVLEARACGTDVKIEDDNPKLKELLEGPIYDHEYYANQILKGITVTLNNFNKI